MPFIEWLFVIYFGLDVLASLYYYSQDGWTTEPSVYVLSVLLGAGAITFLVLSSPLTWFGWVLVALFTYNLALGAYKLTVCDTRSHKGRSRVVVSGLVSVVLLVLALTVGIVA